METKINIAEILKSKSENTKLYSPLYGDVYFSYIGVRNNINVLHHRYVLSDFLYDGRYTAYKESEILLFPSKYMRDWNKFGWKNGDVLISNDGRKEVFFNGFTDDTYALFKAKHGFEVLSDGNTTYLADEEGIATSDYTLEDKNDAQTYINTIEERLGGKLNLETLEIEPAYPEFKDGDIAYADYGHKQAVFIVSGKTNLSEGYNSFIALDLRGLTLDMGCRMSFFKKDLCKLRLATAEEKQQLFEALAKEDKVFDAERKQIVDLKPNVELKPFDRVLVRDCNNEVWRANLFSNYTSDGSYGCVCGAYKQCIPYNEETAKLIGTTDNWEG